MGTGQNATGGSVKFACVHTTVSYNLVLQSIFANVQRFQAENKILNKSIQNLRHLNFI